MDMKRNKIWFITLICVMVVCVVGVGVGCYYGGKSAGAAAGSSGRSNGINSYISTQSQVYNTTAEVVAAVADTVVEIQTESITTQWGKQYIVSGAGSGVIVSHNGSTYYIITNNHVIDGANEISVTTRNGDDFNATLLATDDSADIAVITISSAKDLSVAVWGDSDALNIGDDLIAIGNPLGSLGGTVTKGILSATGRTITVGNYAMTLLQTDTAINPGNSGGGLFSMRGELIGIVNAKTTDEEIEGICFAIPGNTARSVYDDLITNGYIVGRATLNIDIAEGSSFMQSQTFVYVTSAPEMDGEAFLKYDKIYSINGVRISSILEYNVVLSQIIPGDAVQVEVYRGTVTQSNFGSSISFSSEITVFTVTAKQYGA